MRGNRILKMLAIAVFALPAFAAFIYLVMRLWNWLMPDLFGLHPVTYWQMLGLLVLSKILFSRLGGGHHGQGRMRRRMMERWEQMTPEERERFRSGLRGGCGFSEPPSAKPPEG